MLTGAQYWKNYTYFCPNEVQSRISLRNFSNVSCPSFLGNLTMTCFPSYLPSYTCWCTFSYYPPLTHTHTPAPLRSLAHFKIFGLSSLTRSLCKLFDTSNVELLIINFHAEISYSDTSFSMIEWWISFCFMSSIRWKIDAFTFDTRNGCFSFPKFWLFTKANATSTKEKIISTKT